MPQAIPTINIENQIILRAPKATEDDVLSYAKCYNDPKITPFVPDDCIPTTAQDATKDIAYLLDSFRANRGVYWFIVHAKTGEMMGAINLHTIDHYHHKAEIAYEIMGKHQGLGIATKACQAVIDFGFKKMMLNRIEATTITGNAPSMCLLQKLGFCLEGVMQESKFYKGQFVDIALFGLPASRYAANSSTFGKSIKEESDADQERIEETIGSIINLHYYRESIKKAS